jgi:hypothetical protein
MSLPFMVAEPPVSACHTNPDRETDVAQRGHEVSQSYVPTHTLVHDAPPAETVVQPNSLRMASLLPVTYDLK